MVFSISVMWYQPIALNLIVGKCFSIPNFNLDLNRCVTEYHFSHQERKHWFCGSVQTIRKHFFIAKSLLTTRLKSLNLQGTCNRKPWVKCYSVSIHTPLCFLLFWSIIKHFEQWDVTHYMVLCIKSKSAHTALLTWSGWHHSGFATVAAFLRRYAGLQPSQRGPLQASPLWTADWKRENTQKLIDLSLCFV